MHGLCYMGYPWVQARFSGHVFPGETLRTDVWQVDERTVLFTTSVEERTAVANSQAAVVFRNPVHKGVATSQRAAKL